VGRVVSWDEALALREELRAEGKVVVFTNGIFDILHVGHVNFLRAAKSIGDSLFVGLNSDSSARILRGKERPIIPEEERAHILSALECVDYVVIFEEKTAENLIGTLKPDIYAKGGDYTIEDLPEARVVDSYGGEVRILPYLPEHSTTELIERILSRYGKKRGRAESLRQRG
jgi:rfaE bifunctional protein nucleotidyltransferase chain/domain